MRYKKKHLVIVITFCWSLWYLGLVSIGPTHTKIPTQYEIPKDGFEFTNGAKGLPTVKPNDKPAAAALPPSSSSSTSSPDTIETLISTNNWVHNYLPHVNNLSFIYPRIKWSKERRNVTFVIGIPTIKRPSNDTYILGTIRSFFDAMSDKERADCVMVISITEPWDLEFESRLLAEIKDRFPKELGEGSLEVIAPFPQFYPDLDKLKLSLGDPKVRVKWRSKQNMDYGFLMMHCMGKASYYLQMEDDITTVQGFITSMKNTVANEKKKWLSLCFSQLGYIGRLYHNFDLRGIMEYLVKNFDKKPCDWLQVDYLRTIVCKSSQPRKACNEEIGKYTWLIKPTLFQHMGLRSSFQGRINKLTDKYFPKGAKKGLYTNPTVTGLITTLETYKKHTLQSVYDTKGFFWSTAPKKGDCIEFIYNPPTRISRISMMSGERNYPKDIFADATVEILLASDSVRIPTNSSLLHFKTAPLDEADSDISAKLKSKRISVLPDFYKTDTNAQSRKMYIVGNFNNGKFDVTLARDVGKIQIIRVHFHSDLDHWVLLGDMLIL